MRNPSWFAFQALQGSMCGLAGWVLASQIGISMLVGPMILFLFWMLESFFSFRGINIYVATSDERAHMQKPIESGGEPFVFALSMGLLFLGGSAAAGIPAAVCKRPLDAALVGIVSLFTVWGLMYFLPSPTRGSTGESS